jgi:hypothetical protein
MEDTMTRFEYEVTKHPADKFKKLVYFCSEQGECAYDELPADQIESLKDLLNETGSQGWDLVQVLLGSEGIVAIWKRPV